MSPLDNLRGAYSPIIRIPETVTTLSVGTTVDTTIPPSTSSSPRLMRRVRVLNENATAIVGVAFRVRASDAETTAAAFVAVPAVFASTTHINPSTSCEFLVGGNMHIGIISNTAATSVNVTITDA